MYTAARHPKEKELPSFRESGLAALSFEVRAAEIHFVRLKKGFELNAVSRTINPKCKVHRV
jgi:hypothetical protein